jgi:hypothetical protein
VANEAEGLVLSKMSGGRMIMPVAENVESEIIHIRHKDFVVFVDKSFRVNRPARVGRCGVSPLLTTTNATDKC